MKVKTLIAGTAVVLLLGGLGVCVAQEAPAPASSVAPEAAPSPAAESAPAPKAKHLAIGIIVSIMHKGSSASRSCSSIRRRPRVSERPRRFRCLGDDDNGPLASACSALALAGCEKKDFHSLLPLSYLSQRERRLRKEASSYAGC